MLWKNCLSPVSVIWAHLEAELGFLGHGGGIVTGQMPVPTEASLGRVG